MTSIQYLRTRTACLSIFVCCIFLLSACVSTMNLGLGGSSLPSASQSIIAEARDAWDSNNMQRAENLYGKATKISLPVAEQSEAWERFAIAAARNGRPNNALEALAQWQKLVPGSESTHAWQEAWRTSVRLLSPSSSIEQAKNLWGSSQAATFARAQAAMLLVGRSWSANESISALPLLNEYYVSLDLGRKQDAERYMSEEVRYMNSVTLQSLGQQIQSTNTMQFPAPIILLEIARRGLTTDANLLARIQDPTLYADQSLPLQMLSGAGNKLSASATQSNQPTQAGQVGQMDQALLTPLAQNLRAQNACIVLALPHSGPVMSIAQKVRSGADVAQSQLQAQGLSVEIHHVDTSQPTWIDQVNALPAQCAVVGGLVQKSEYDVIKSRGVTATRNIFAFLPALEGQDEGSTAWRFFPSPNDQVGALLNFTRQMGINAYGSFYPTDSYGTRMNSIFTESVRAMGGSVQAVSYPAEDKAAWTGAATSLLQPVKINGAPFPTSSFSAVFLPDSWKNMDLITQAMLFNGEDRLILLGTSLWEQSLLSGGVSLNTTATTKNFGLAIFPAAWNPTQKAPALQSIADADFWTGLGFDFVQLGARLALPAKVVAADLNQRLQSAQNMPFSMAPIMWSSSGKATQELFLLTLTDGGIMPADAHIMQQRRLVVLNAFEQRRIAASNATPE